MEYLIHLLVLFCIYAIVSMSLNLVVGYTGLLSVSHAAFFGIGGYVAAILMKESGVNFFLALALGMAAALLAGAAVGQVLSRFRGDYYALVSLGFNVIAFGVMVNWDSFTKGPLGIPAIPRPSLGPIEFKENYLFLLLSICFMLAAYGLSRYVVGASVGRALKAIREDEKALQVFGYKTNLYKHAVFIMSAGLAGGAGAIFASYISFIHPSAFTVMESVMMLAMIIVGGLASIRGSLLGTGILIALPELLRFVGLPSAVAAQLRQAIYGIILIVLMFKKPEGIWGEYRM